MKNVSKQRISELKDRSIKTPQIIMQRGDKNFKKRTDKKQTSKNCGHYQYNTHLIETSEAFPKF
jgi:hypothetical protein